MRSVLVNGHVWHEDERRRKSLWLSLQFLWSASALICACGSMMGRRAARWLVWKPRWLDWKPSWISVQRDNLLQNLKGFNLYRAKIPSLLACLSNTRTYQIPQRFTPKVKMLHPLPLWNFVPLLVLWTDKFPLLLTQAPPSAPLPWSIETTLKYCTFTLISSLERKSNIQCKIWNCPSHPVF